MGTTGVWILGISLSLLGIWLFILTVMFLIHGIKFFKLHNEKIEKENQIILQSKYPILIENEHILKPISELIENKICKYKCSKCQKTGLIDYFKDCDCG